MTERQFVLRLGQPFLQIIRHREDDQYTSNKGFDTKFIVIFNWERERQRVSTQNIAARRLQLELAPWTPAEPAHDDAVNTVVVDLGFSDLESSLCRYRSDVCARIALHTHLLIHESKSACVKSRGLCH